MSAVDKKKAVVKVQQDLRTRTLLNLLSDDPLKILSLGADPTAQEITTNFQRLSAMFDPATNAGDEEAAIALRKVTKAYEILKPSGALQLHGEASQVVWRFVSTFCHPAAQESSERVARDRRRKQEEMRALQAAEAARLNPDGAKSVLNATAAAFTPTAAGATRSTATATTWGAEPMANPAVAAVQFGLPGPALQPQQRQHQRQENPHRQQQPNQHRGSQGPALPGRGGRGGRGGLAGSRVSSGGFVVAAAEEPVDLADKFLQEFLKAQANGTFQAMLSGHTASAGGASPGSTPPLQQQQKRRAREHQDSKPQPQPQPQLQPQQLQPSSKSARPPKTRVQKASPVDPATEAAAPSAPLLRAPRPQKSKSAAVDGGPAAVVNPDPTAQPPQKVTKRKRQHKPEVARWLPPDTTTAGAGPSAPVEGTLAEDLSFSWGDVKGGITFGGPDSDDNDDTDSSDADGADGMPQLA